MLRMISVAFFMRRRAKEVKANFHVTSCSVTSFLAPQNSQSWIPMFYHTPVCRFFWQTKRESPESLVSASRSLTKGAGEIRTVIVVWKFMQMSLKHLYFGPLCFESSLELSFEDAICLNVRNNMKTSF